MAKAAEARDWARVALRGIGDSLYTPFCGVDGDDIDWAAYRQLVRYCVSDLGHEMLWCTSGVAEFWALTIEERKRLLEVALEADQGHGDIAADLFTKGRRRGDRGQGLPRAHPPRRGGRRRHRVPADADDGDARW